MSRQDTPDPDPLDALDSETIEDLDADDAADDVAGGWDFTTTTCFGNTK